MQAYFSISRKSKSTAGNLELMEPQDEFIIKVSIGYSHIVFLNNLGEVYAR
jgi:alpha-tubulin suppressor-like RCC1 family protein